MQTDKISIAAALGALTFLPDRRPDSAPAVLAQAFATLCRYRDGGIFVGHYAGDSAWERHPEEEIVIVLEGETTLFLAAADGEARHALGALDMLVVPKGVWHRFATPAGVKILSVTPQPTEHAAPPPAGDS